MSKRFACVALIDDNPADNFVHERAVRKSNIADSIVVFEDAALALAAIRDGTCEPDLIFLDINMPGMDGWEFLDAYHSLAESARQAIVVVMLTTSPNPADRARGGGHRSLDDFCEKPLTVEMCRRLLERFRAAPT